MAVTIYFDDVATKEWQIVFLFFKNKLYKLTETMDANRLIVEWILCAKGKIIIDQNGNDTAKLH